MNGFSIILPPPTFGSTPVSEGITIKASNVVVKNGKIVNPQTGINIQGLTLAEKAQAKTIYDNGGDVDAYYQSLYAIHPQNVTIENVEIDAITHGIYIQPRTKNINILNNTINDGRLGIYVDSGVKNTVIEGNTFNHVGWEKYISALGIVVPVPQGSGREAIALDGALYTTIEGNTFNDSNLADITLYRNCWEKWNTPLAYPRIIGAYDTAIDNNIFNDTVKAIWVASRQQRDLSGFDCGSPEGQGGGLWLDHATETHVRTNTFNNNSVAVEVADDNNTIVANTLNGAIIDQTAKADGNMPTNLVINGNI